MDREQLIQRLKGYEWEDLEFKAAQRGVPGEAYTTVSAFANTQGGRLVFGVRDQDGDLEVVGVIEVDRVQNDFLTVLRSGQKFNRAIEAEGQLLEDEDKTLIVFYIPEARRQDKPVYLNGNIKLSFLRRGAADERCTPAEIERLLRDAADVTYDSVAVDLDPERCFDASSVRWYRRLLEDRTLSHDPEWSDTDFLLEWGLIVETGDRLAPTRAAVLLFGSASAFHQLLPRPVVDWQWHRGDWSDGFDDQRWTDRLVIESNLMEAWKALHNRYLQRAEVPFSVDPETLQRADRPPDYAAFREAAINLLVHQDYADHSRKAEIHSHDDRTSLWNPGDAFVSAEALLEPRGKAVRNPRIVTAFRRIGLSEQAGSGLRAIFGNQRQLGHVPPVIASDRVEKTFEITLLKEELVSERQLLLQASLGVRLSDPESRAFAFACREGRLRPGDVRAVTGLSGGDVMAVLNRLTAQALISPLEGSEAPLFVPAAHLEEQLGELGRAGAFRSSDAPSAPPPGDLSTAQPGQPTANLSTAQAPVLAELTAVQDRIIRLCDTPRRLAELMSAARMKNRGYFKARHLNPLLQARVLRMTHPNRPNHPHQAYVLTPAGTAIKARRLSASAKSTAPTNGEHADDR